MMFIINARKIQQLFKFVFLLISVQLIACQSTVGINKDVSVEASSTRGYIDERNKPIPVYNGPQRSGVQVYAQYCATCHNRTTQGAPLPDDDIEWSRRLKKGKEVLVNHVLNGYKELMPVKGGCLNCSEAEVRGAINYIYEKSGIDGVKF